MAYLEKINKNTRVLAKDENYYLVTNDPDASIEDFFKPAFVIDSNGRHVTATYDMNWFFREEEAKWEKTDETIENIIKSNNITKEALIGLAVGDALGVPVEFLSRSEVRLLDYKDMDGLKDMKELKSRWSKIIPAGCWSDDTSMTISEMDTIINDNGVIDYEKIMSSFIKWWNKGMYCATSFPFGLGGVVSDSLERFLRKVPALECGGKGIRDNGNGSLMRILPFSLYCIATEMDTSETADFISKASAITHGHDIAKMGCFIYTELLRALNICHNPKMAFGQIINIDFSKYFSQEAIAAYSKLLSLDFLSIKDSEIDEKNGYVVTSLETAIYSLLKGNDYESTILTAINMGYDTDTIGAITGSLAAVTYGQNSIPERWTNKLAKREYLENIATKYDNVINSLEKKTSLSNNLL